jgi:hypothetical protein
VDHSYEDTSMNIGTGKGVPADEPDPEIAKLGKVERMALGSRLQNWSERRQL